MKALSVRQPWAGLIAAGVKTVEVRTWSVDYRGPLLIVSSAKPAGLGPAGVALAVVELHDCRPLEVDDAEAACVEVEHPHYVEGRWAWCLRLLHVPESRAVSGRLGLYDVPDHFLRR